MAIIYRIFVVLDRGRLVFVFDRLVLDRGRLVFVFDRLVLDLGRLVFVFDRLDFLTGVFLGVFNPVLLVGKVHTSALRAPSNPENPSLTHFDPIKIAGIVVRFKSWWMCWAIDALRIRSSMGLTLEDGAPPLL
jgi:hypothetical protein